MKSALQARLTGPNWVDELPWVSAELVYWGPTQFQTDHSFQLQHLRNQVRTLAPVPTVTPASVPAEPNMFSSIVVPTVPLQHPYEGPFKVIESGKAFKVDIGGNRKTEIITIDRLKLAHLDVDSPIQVAQPQLSAQQAVQLHAPSPSTSQLPRWPLHTKGGWPICWMITSRFGGGGGGGGMYLSTLYHNIVPKWLILALCIASTAHRYRLLSASLFMQSANFARKSGTCAALKHRWRPEMRTHPLGRLATWRIKMLHNAHYERPLKDSACSLFIVLSTVSLNNVPVAMVLDIGASFAALEGIYVYQTVCCCGLPN